MPWLGTLSRRLVDPEILQRLFLSIWECSLTLSFRGECFESWSLRYLREAKVDFSLASNASMIETVKDLSTIALRKAQLAIQYALAEPELLDIAVSEYISRGSAQERPLIILLARIRKLMQKISDPQSKLTRKKILEKTGLVIDVASSVVSACLVEKADKSSRLKEEVRS